MEKSRYLLFVLLAFFAAANLQATTTCSFIPAGTTLTLQNDCTTDASLVVPQGVTMDLNGHTVTANDPPLGHFMGGVIINGGTSASVTNGTVQAAGLSDVCDGGANELRGVLFDGAAGSITNLKVLNINQGASGCQEGNAIEVRNAPFDNTGTDVAVTITGNIVTNYQKNGITANGSVAAIIMNNVVTGAGPVNYIAQNGIQIGFGATAVVKNNTVSGNDYTPTSFVACGILYFTADGVRASENKLSGNERNFCNFGKGEGNPTF